MGEFVEKSFLRFFVKKVRLKFSYVLSLGLGLALMGVGSYFLVPRCLQMIEKQTTRDGCVQQNESKVRQVQSYKDEELRISTNPDLADIKAREMGMIPKNEILLLTK